MKPQLDVSDVLLSPEFADSCTVIQRLEVVTDGGEVTTPSNNPIPNVVAVFTAASPNQLERYPDMQWGTRTHNCITKFRLRGVAEAANGDNFQPDLVVWDGITFIVQVIEPYTRYGAGFIQAIITSMDFKEPPLT